MNKIRAGVPVQYTDLDGISSRLDVNLKDILVGKNGNKNKRALNHLRSGSNTFRYQQVAIGFGPRSDFRKLNGPNADFNHDFDRMGSLN